MMAWGIRYDGRSWFREMTGIGPAFGATLEQTPRYLTKREALEVIRQMTPLASLLCEVVRLGVRKPKRRRKPK